MQGNSVVEYCDSRFRNYENVSPQEVVDFYKNLGDWQNVLTKTDYTYSPISVYHKKKINGIYPVIPNMSRPFLWTYEFVDETTEIMHNIINRKLEQHLVYSRSTSDSKTVQKWTSDDKRSFFAPSSAFAHFFLLSVIIFLVLLSIKQFPFYF